MNIKKQLKEVFKQFKKDLKKIDHYDVIVTTFTFTALLSLRLVVGFEITVMVIFALAIRYRLH